MTTFLENTAKEIDRRLAELRKEISQLEAARTALRGDAPQSLAGGRPTRAASPAPPPRQPSSTSRSSSGTASSPRRGRRSGARAGRALELVRQKPGITINELARSMKIEPNYLYRVLPKLAADGEVKRDGRGWHPTS